MVSDVISGIVSINSHVIRRSVPLTSTCQNIGATGKAAAVTTASKEQGDRADEEVQAGKRK